jgi:hypothetical protein
LLETTGIGFRGKPQAWIRPLAKFFKAPLIRNAVGIGLENKLSHCRVGNAHPTIFNAFINRIPKGEARGTALTRNRCPRREEGMGVRVSPGIAINVEF